jgi:hypothetical protein
MPLTLRLSAPFVLTALVVALIGTGSASSAYVR